MTPLMASLLASVPDGRVFALDQQTLIGIGITAINVVILAVVLYRLLYDPVRGFMARRTDRIKTELELAKDELGRARALQNQYEKKLRAVEQERYEIVEAARKLAAEKSKQLLAEAKRDADAVRARATQEVEMERERVKDEMKQAIIEVSSAIAQKYIAIVMDKETHDKLFAETMAELDDLPFIQADTVAKKA